jgi:hypothetical protein
VIPDWPDGAEQTRLVFAKPQRIGFMTREVPSPCALEIAGARNSLDQLTSGQPSYRRQPLGRLCST